MVVASVIAKIVVVVGVVDVIGDGCGVGGDFFCC